MTDKELDRLIFRFLLDVSAWEWDQEEELLDDIEFHPSLRYRCSIRAMLRNPLKWCRNRRRSAWQRVARATASVLLTVTILFATIMAVSPTARATVKNWLLKWYEEHIYYQFTDDITQGNPLDYELTYIPDGYVEVDRLERQIRKYVRYRNSEGNLLKFECQIMRGGNATSIRTEHSPTCAVRIHECNGELYLSDDPSMANCIVWRDIKANLQFTIYGLFGEESLTAMAKSVKLSPLN